MPTSTTTTGEPPPNNGPPETPATAQKKKPRRRRKPKKAQAAAEAVAIKDAASSSSPESSPPPLQLPYLNDDVLLHIFSHCRTDDLLNLHYVCARFRHLLAQHTLPQLSRTILMTSTLHPHSDHAKRTSRPPATAFHRVRISDNWLLGRYHEEHLLQHNVMFPTFVQLERDTVWASQEGAIQRHRRQLHDRKPNKTSAGRPPPPLSVHPFQRYGNVRDPDITCFRVRDGTLFGGRMNGNCFVYDVDNVTNTRRGDPVRQLYETYTLDGPDGGGRPLHYMDGQQRDNSVLAVDMRGACYATSNCQRLTLWTRSTELGVPLLEPVFDVSEDFKALAFQATADGDWLACGRYRDSSGPGLRLVHAERFVRRTLTSQTRAVYGLRWLDANRLVTGNFDGTCRVHDLRANADVRRWADPYGAAVYSVESDGAYGLLAGMSMHCRVNVYDVRMEKRPVQMIFPRSSGWSTAGSPVYQLACDETQLFVATAHSLRVMDFATEWAPVRDYRQVFENVQMFLPHVL